MLVGSEWLIDAHGCREDALRDPELVLAVLGRVIAELGLHTLGQPLVHAFPPPGGVTGLWLLTESHLACHTYPEHALATFNLYCCRPRPGWEWKRGLAEMLGARRVVVRRCARGRLVAGATLLRRARAAGPRRAP